MKFSEIIGHEDIKKVLVSMADSGRVPHAMLFYENEGCGGLALALAFIQYINCRHRHDGDSCGECPSCNKISKLIHPDMHFVFPVTSGPKADSSSKPTSDSYIRYWRELVLGNPYFLEKLRSGGFHSWIFLKATLPTRRRSRSLFCAVTLLQVLRLPQYSELTSEIQQKKSELIRYN